MEGGSADEALARCLACARATPPDQRTPEVAAFIESDDLLAEVKQLLPLNAEGQAAEAGDGPELRRRALLAALKLARAEYACPETPPAREPMLDCIAAYSRLLLPTPTTPAALAAAGQSSFSDAAQALALLPLPGARAACRRALAALDAARRARRGALPTLRQLRYLLLACLADAAHQALVLHGSPSPELAQLAASRGLVTGLSPADLRAARDGLEQAVRAMVQQEPDNPKGYELAALAAGQSVEEAGRAIDFKLRAHKLGLAQGSDWWTAHSALTALALLAEPTAAAACTAGTLRALAAAQALVPAARERCKRVLPSEWMASMDVVGEIEGQLRQTAALAQRERQQQQQQQQDAGPAPSAAREVGAPAAVTPDDAACAACHQPSKALQLCLACKSVKYCSRDCQRAHWPEHKSACRAAAARHQAAAPALKMVTTRQKRLAIRGGELAVEEAPTPKRRRSTAAAPASPKKQQKQPAAPTSPTGVKKKKAPPEPATTKKKQKQQQEQKGGAAAASGAGGSGEAPAAASDHIAINRAPVLTLWVAVVAQRQGFSFDEGLTFGKTVSGWLAQSKGRKLGIFEKKEKDEEEREERRAAEAAAGVERVNVFGMKVPVVPGPPGERYAWSGSAGEALEPASAQRYLERAFKGRLADAKAAMEELAAAVPANQIGTKAMPHYEAFRPEWRGWGQASTLDLGRVRDLARTWWHDVQGRAGGGSESCAYCKDGCTCGNQCNCGSSCDCSVCPGAQARSASYIKPENTSLGATKTTPTNLPREPKCCGGESVAATPLSGAAAPPPAAAADPAAAPVAAPSTGVVLGSGSDADVRKSVEQYYSEVAHNTREVRIPECFAKAPKSPVVRQALARVPDQVMSKFLGCGSPIPLGIQGLRVLDLGSGSGRDSYVCAALLELASKHADDYCTEALGYSRSNMRFLKGEIEDLAAAGIPDSSVDLVISNCVVNLSPNKLKVLKEAFRVLAPGGEMHFSDIYADRRLPEEVRKHLVLLAECVGGIMYERDFLRLCREAGFVAPLRLEARTFEVPEELRGVVGDVRPASLTYRLFKLPKGLLEEGNEDYGQCARYQGTIHGSPHSYWLDEALCLPAGKWVQVDGNAAAILQHSWLAKHFEVAGDRSKHFGAFGCSGAQQCGGGGAAGATGRLRHMVAGRAS
ncbi:arsenite methyltransferase isoform B [Micractinium conductrix]|uniref:Arsenite methyltransferase n=1 Tax=Micractinium conductrix TaxID=554055 RepID=A0A2P6VB90_9CHLO|nr:arsenite methyltransferase isoform B [Micractinium conductrix]|eukprot:PSC71360.1 arsenite methyltransferase isoform B [Micractinium conductrix]